MLDVGSWKVGRVLLVSRDYEASRQISDTMQEHGLSVEASIDIAAASNRLSRQKYEVVLIDLALGPKAILLLHELRNSASNRTAVTFALTTDRDDTALALKHGFRFVLEKPLTSESIWHTLKVAYGLIVRERRRYFRYTTVVLAVLSRKAESEVYARTINVSEGGIAVCTSTPLPVGTETTVEFTLSDPKLRIKAKGKVCWRNDDGVTGLAFVFIPSEMASGLRQWLALKLEKQLPASVVGKFRDSGPLTKH